MSWLGWLAIAVLIGVVAAVTGIKPKGYASRREDPAHGCRKVLPAAPGGAVRVPRAPGAERQLPERSPPSKIGSGCAAGAVRRIRFRVFALEPVQRDSEKAHGPCSRLRLLDEGSARARISSADCVAGRRVSLRVIVWNVAYRSFSVTVRAKRLLRASAAAAWSRERRDLVAHPLELASGLARTSPRSRSTCARGSARRRDRRSPCDRLPQPLGGELPTALRRASSPAVRTSTRRSIPTARRRRAVTGPTPQSASTGSFWRNDSTRSGAMTVRPSGFFHPDAIFARNLFGATPAEAVRPVSSRIRSLSRRATSTPSGEAPGVLRHVEVRLVERQPLDERRRLPEDLEDLPRDGGVLGEVRPAR